MLQGVTSYFYVHSQSNEKYENDDTPNIHHTEEEPPWYPSAEEYSEREVWILDHQDQVIVFAIMARGLVFISAVTSYSMAYDAIDVMDDDSFMSALDSDMNVVLHR